MYLTQELARRAPLPPHEILQVVRSQMEEYHRQTIYLLSTKRAWYFCLSPPDGCSWPLHQDIRDMSPLQVEDCCNKIVPIYITPGHGESGPLLRVALHNWLYNNWFQPYRSEIEYGQFIAKQFYTCSPPVETTPALLIQLINGLHGKICDQITSYQSEAMTSPAEPDYPGGPYFRDQRHFILQPLFRALTIILLGHDFDVRIADMGKLPVLLTLTGEERGLSKPLSFESISSQVEKRISETTVQVSLRAAIEFVFTQQNREIDIFGMQPDPVGSTQGLKNGLNLAPESTRIIMRELGWTDEPVDGPSSTWVDTEIYTEPVDKSYIQYEEERERFKVICHMAGVAYYNRSRVQRRKSL